MARPWRADLDLPANLDTARVARRVLDQLLHAWGNPWFRDDGRVVLTELVANAFLHAGGGPLHLTLEFDPDGDILCIALSDASQRLPVVREVDPGTEVGRGMRIVHHLAERWGTATHPTGKTVWVELRHRQSP